MSKDLQVVVSVLQETPMCFIATVSNGKPKVRPFQFQLETDNKLWFCTSKKKDVFFQLAALHYVQLCAVKTDSTTLRVDGCVVFEDNYEIKKRIIEKQPLVKSIYGSQDNPDFTTFFIEHGEYTIFDFSGNPPRTGSF